MEVSQTLFHDLVEFAPDALILLDKDGTIHYANSHAHTLFGYEPNTMSGISIEALVPAESRESHASHRHDYLLEPRLREMGNRSVALFGLRKDGSRFRAEIRLAPIQTTNGVLSAAAVRDATANAEITNMLAAARQSAEDANEAKSKLLAAASHDLRQPLQTLRLLNSSLKRLITNPYAAEVLQQEEAALETMSELLHALLNIAKLDSGTLQPTMSDAWVPAIFEDLHRQFAGLAKLKNLTLAVVELDVYIRTDAILLRELLQNLLANAVRYTDTGHIHLRCVRGEPGRVFVQVEDTGVGIADSMRERIFDDFFQEAPRGRLHRGGAGLGLGIVKRLSCLLHTPLRVASVLGEGTCFTIEVPTSEVSAAISLDPRSATAVTHRKGHSIILVEDNPAMRVALKTYLQLDDHQVHTAGSMAELEELLETFEVPPSIVISDYHLGAEESGSDAIERIRQRFQSPLPAILLTGDTSAVPVRLASRAGIHMLSKPVDAEQLIAVLDELLCSPHHRATPAASNTQVFE